MMFVIGCLIVLLASQQPSPPAPSLQGLPPGYIEIDGSKTPSAIPDWVAWHSTLRLLAAAAKAEKSLFLPDSLAPKDRELIVAAARNQVALDTACEQRQLKTGARLKDGERSRMMAALQQEQLSCRIELLDATDVLLSRLSQSAVMWLTDLVEESRSGIKSFVHKDGLAHYRRPR